jgi:hypothetical protein
MTDQDTIHGPDAEVVQLHPDRTPATEPPPAAHVAEPEPGKRRPIVPEHLAPANIRGTVRHAAGLHLHRTA